MIAMRIPFLCVLTLAAVFSSTASAISFRKDLVLREMENETPLVQVNDSTVTLEDPSSLTAYLKQEIPRLAHQFLARIRCKISPPPPPVDEVTTRSLSLDEMLKDKGFLKSAWVQFDSSRQIWTAKWNKPTLLNYGMLLKPALDKQFSSGDWLAFESAGVPTVITKKNNELVVVSNGNSIPLGVNDLNRLLTNKISLNGMSLSVDASGNLILQATGSKATQMAKLKT